MKPLAVLLLTFALAAGATRVWYGQADYLLAGNVALAVLLLFTGIAHFPYATGMMQVLPAWLPARRGWATRGFGYRCKRFLARGRGISGCSHYWVSLRP